MIGYIYDLYSSVYRLANYSCISTVTHMKFQETVSLVYKYFEPFVAEIQNRLLYFCGMYILP